MAHAAAAATRARPTTPLRATGVYLTTPGGRSRVRQGRRFAERRAGNMGLVAGRRLSFALVAAGVMLAAVATGGASARATAVHVSVYAQTGIKLTDIVWTGRRFLYVENTTNVLYAAPPSGAPLTQVAAMPNETEETRCVLSPG